MGQQCTLGRKAEVQELRLGRRESFPCEDSQTVEEVDEKGCAGSLLGDFQDQLKSPEELSLTLHWSGFEQEVGLKTC